MNCREMQLEHYLEQAFGLPSEEWKSEAWTQFERLSLRAARGDRKPLLEWLRGFEQSLLKAWDDYHARNGSLAEELPSAAVLEEGINCWLEAIDLIREADDFRVEYMEVAEEGQRMMSLASGLEEVLPAPSSTSAAPLRLQLGGLKGPAPNGGSGSIKVRKTPVTPPRVDSLTALKASAVAHNGGLFFSAAEAPTVPSVRGEKLLAASAAAFGPETTAEPPTSKLSSTSPLRPAPSLDPSRHLEAIVSAFAPEA